MSRAAANQKEQENSEAPSPAGTRQATPQPSISQKTKDLPAPIAVKQPAPPAQQAPAFLLWEKEGWPFGEAAYPLTRRAAAPPVFLAAPLCGF